MKITKEQQKLLNEALTKTLHAYEDLIEDPKGNIDKWKRYGDASKCRLCKATDELCNDCDVCPIITGYNREHSIGVCGYTDRGGTLLDMRLAVVYYFETHTNMKLVVTTARQRLANLISAAEANGYEYK